jgi:hypothetical protein
MDGNGMQSISIHNPADIDGIPMEGGGRAKRKRAISPLINVSALDGSASSSMHTAAMSFYASPLPAAPTQSIWSQPPNEEQHRSKIARTHAPHPPLMQFPSMSSPPILLDRPNHKRSGVSIDTQHEQERPSKKQVQLLHKLQTLQLMHQQEQQQEQQRSSDAYHQLAVPPLSDLTAANRLLQQAHEERVQRRRAQQQLHQYRIMHTQAAKRQPPLNTLDGSNAVPTTAPIPSQHSFVYRSPSNSSAQAHESSLNIAHMQLHSPSGQTSPPRGRTSDNSNAMQSSAVSISAFADPSVPSVRLSSPKLLMSPLARFQQHRRAHTIGVDERISDAPLSGLRSQPAHLPWHVDIPIQSTDAHVTNSYTHHHSQSSWASSPTQEEITSETAVVAGSTPVYYARRPLAIVTSPWNPSRTQQRVISPAVLAATDHMQRSHSGNMAD